MCTNLCLWKHNFCFLSANWCCQNQAVLYLFSHWSLKCINETRTVSDLQRIPTSRTNNYLSSIISLDIFSDPYFFLHAHPQLCKVSSTSVKELCLREIWMDGWQTDREIPKSPSPQKGLRQSNRKTNYFNQIVSKLDKLCKIRVPPNQKCFQFLIEQQVSRLDV